jgi:predicted MFS family arabinose efflux permease
MPPTSTPAADALWRDRDFAKLWSAAAVSAFGARITREGLPMAAVLTLRASPAEIGLLAALSYGPALLVGLAAGGFVDRRRRRGLLVAMDLLRAAVLATIPLAAWLRLLSMPQLYVAAAVVGAASVLFQIADHAYLPGLVAREAITRANSSLSATDSVAEVAGPALAGVLFQWFAGPFAVAVNAATYLVSAAFLAAIARREPAPVAAAPTHWAHDIVDGVRAAVREPRVAPLLFITGSNALFGSFFAALYVFFALRVLGLTPAMLGVTIGAGGVGGLAGALLAPRLSAWVGSGRAIVLSAAGAALLNGLIPLAPPDPKLGMAFLTTAQVFGDALAVTAAVLAASLRQTLIPQAILGRVAATFQAVGGGAAVVGALAGGALGGLIGPRQTLYIAAGGLLLGSLVAACSPLRRATA